MEVYNNLKELEKDVVNDVLRAPSNNCVDIRFKLNYPNLVINAHNIVASNINVSDIYANNITAGDIVAGNIKAYNIKAGNINAYNINANNIEANNIKTNNIKASNIAAGSINANCIIYYAVCFAYRDIKCKSIEGSRHNSKHFCIDGEIVIKNDEHIINIDGKEIKISEDSYKSLKDSLGA